MLYAGALGVEGLVQLLVVPLSTRAVAVEVYGAYALVMVTLPIVAAAIDGGCSAAAVKRLAGGEAAPGERGAVLGTLLASQLILSTAVAAAGWWLLPRLSWAGTAGPHGPAIAPLLAATLWTWVIYEVAVEALRAQERHRAAASAMLARALARAAAVAILVVKLELGLAGLVGALLVGQGVGLAVAVAAGLLAGAGRPSLGQYRSMLRFGAPLAAAYLLRIGLGADRHLVSRVLSLAHAGLYQLATVPSLGLGLLSRAGLMAAEPYLFRAAGGEDRRPLQRATSLYSFAMLAFALTMGAFAEELVRLLGPASYAGALAPLPWMVFATAADTLFHMVGFGSQLSGRTRSWPLAAALELGLSFGLMALALPYFGLVGAAAARLAGAVVGMAACYGLSFRDWPVRLPVGLLALASVGGAVATSALLGAPLWARAAAWAAGTALLGLAFLRGSGREPADHLAQLPPA